MAERNGSLRNCTLTPILLPCVESVVARAYEHSLA